MNSDNKQPMGDGIGNAQQQEIRQSKEQQSSVAGLLSDQSGSLYDGSFLDPLQAHALQLTASAGLPNLLSTSSGNTSQTSQSHQPLHQQQPQTSQTEQLRRQQPTPQHSLPQIQYTLPHPGHPVQQTQQQQYYYVPQNGTATNTLTPIAPVVPQNVASMVQTGNHIILPATAQGAIPFGTNPTILMPQQFPPPPLPSAASKKRTKQNSSVSKQQTRKKKRQLDPSVVSSTTSTDSSGQGISKDSRLDQPKESKEPEVDLSKMTAAERRRHERNLREQQRSYKISQQIKELREVLSASNVPFKPNKYSILMSVVEYIKQLQSRAIMLDAEHQKLITTIRQTNDLVGSGNVPPSSADETDATNITGNTSSSDPGSDSEMFFVQGLNYKNIFANCPAALGIAALDGRILECNPEFQLLLGFSREELLKQSLFNLVHNHQDIFQGMAEMLKVAEDEPIALNQESSPSTPKSYIWSGPVVSKRDVKLLMNLTLTLGDDGSAKFFNCSVTST